MPTYFYLLEARSGQEWRYMAALLIEKAYQCGYSIYILCESPAEASKLHTQLWEYREDACLPHQLYKAQQYNPNIPIQIGDTSIKDHPSGHILMNMSSQVPDFYQQFPCLIELVPNEVNRRQQAREKYRHYQRNNEQLITYNIQGIPELPELKIL